MKDEGTDRRVKDAVGEWQRLRIGLHQRDPRIAPEPGAGLIQHVAVGVDARKTRVGIEGGEAGQERSRAASYIQDGFSIFHPERLDGPVAKWASEAEQVDRAVVQRREEMKGETWGERPAILCRRHVGPFVG